MLEYIQDIPNHLDVNAYGQGIKPWSFTKMVDLSDWDPDVLLWLFGIPSWSVDAELILMNWGRE